MVTKQAWCCWRRWRAMRMANIVWQPQPKQAAFMARSEYECLYGGAAGGGKSDALLAEALRQVHIPHYRAIIFRKTYPQLSELIDRSRAIYSAAFPARGTIRRSIAGHFPAGQKSISDLCNIPKIGLIIRANGMTLSRSTS